MGKTEITTFSFKTNDEHIIKILKGLNGNRSEFIRNAILVYHFGIDRPEEKLQLILNGLEEIKAGLRSREPLIEDESVSIESELDKNLNAQFENFK